MKFKFLATGVLTAVLALPVASHAYNACHCVQYIKNRVGDQSSAGHAYYMDNYLMRNGYRQVDLRSEIPRNKDIVIIRQNNPWGYDRNYGHVAIVSSAGGWPNDGFSIDLVSSNMNNTAWNGVRKSNPRYAERSEYGCDNVSGNTLSVRPYQYDYIAVYRR